MAERENLDYSMDYFISPSLRAFYKVKDNRRGIQFGEGSGINKWLDKNALKIKGNINRYVLFNESFTSNITLIRSIIRRKSYRELEYQEEITLCTIPYDKYPRDLMNKLKEFGFTIPEEGQ